MDQLLRSVEEGETSKGRGRVDLRNEGVWRKDRPESGECGGRIDQELGSVEER